MWKILIVGYLVIATITFISVMVLLFHAWNKESEEEKYMGMEYPEDAGSGITAACIFFVISLLAAVIWPFFPAVLIGLWALEKFQKKFPDLCSMTEEGEDEPEGDCK